MKTCKNCYYVGERLSKNKAGCANGVELFCIVGRYRPENHYPNSQRCPEYSERGTPNPIWVDNWVDNEDPEKG